MTKFSRRPRGVAVLLALFVAMLALTGAYVATAQAHQNLQTSTLGAQRVRRQMAVKGAVNHLLVLLRQGNGNQYTETSPLVLDIAGVEDIKVWVMPDSNFSGVLHIRAASEGTGYSKTILTEPPTESIVYMRSDDNDLYSRRAGDLNWQTVPPPPQTLYRMSDGSTVNRPLGSDQNAGDAMIRTVAADEDGLMMVTTYNSPESLLARHLWDNRSQNWTTLPPLPNFRFSGGQPQVDPGIQLTATEGFSEGKLYSVCNDGLAIYDTSSSQWEFHETPPGLTNSGTCVGGGKLVGRTSSTIEVFEDGSWTSLPLTDPDIQPVGVDPDGNIYGAKVDYGGGQTSYNTYTMSANGWSAVSLPPELQGKELHAVDGAGGLVFKTSGTEVTVLDSQQQLDVVSLPAGETLRAHPGSRSRRLAGGGEEMANAPPQMSVVSSY